MNLEQALKDAENSLAEAEKELEKAQRRVESLRAEKIGLQMAIRRHSGEPTKGEKLLGRAVEVLDVIAKAHNWKSLARTEAIEQVLAGVNRPLSPTDLSALLRNRGRMEDRPDYVSASLAHLKKKGRVASAGYGLWILTPEARADHARRQGVQRLDVPPIEGQVVVR